MKPKILVCLGATAARSAIGREHGVLADRGRFFPHQMAGAVTATVHPSAILRAPDPIRRQADYEAFVKDLVAVWKRLNRGAAGTHATADR